MARGGGMQQVELLDGDEPLVESVSEPVRSRRGVLRVVVGVAVVVLALVGTQGVVDARERAAVARLARVPGVLPAFGDELTVSRRLAPGEVGVLWGGIRSATGATSSLKVADDGSQAFVGIDSSTGERLWSTPLLGPHAERAASLVNSYGGGCQPDVHLSEAASVAVCLVTDGFTRYSTEGAEERVPATTTRAVVFDPADGHLVWERAVAPDAQLAVLPGLLVVGTWDAERIEAVAYDLRSGDERWRYDEPRDGDPGGAGESSSYWSFFRAGDVVVFSVGNGLGFLSATGESVRDDLRTRDGDGGWGTEAATGNLIFFSYSGSGGGGEQTSTLLAADADPSRDVVLEGQLIEPSVDDGSVPGLVVTSSDRLHAWDRRTGDRLWDAEGQGTGSALVARGKVYLTTATGISALDGRTGAVVWTRDLPAASTGTLATDGRDLLVPTAYAGVSIEELGADATGGGMTGYDLATGEETRYVPYPEEVFDVQAFRGLLVGWSPTSDETFVLE